MWWLFGLLACVVGCSGSSHEEVCEPIGCERAAAVTVHVALDSAALLKSKIELCRNEQCSRADLTAVSAGTQPLVGALSGTVTVTEASSGFELRARTESVGNDPHGLVTGDRYTLRVLGEGGVTVADASFVATSPDAAACPNCATLTKVTK
jgi:hypothetical protein